jgi:osmotically inducible protein OsmC
MAVLYTAKVRAEGGRDGQVTSSDGILNLKLSLPKGLGGKENATNPEQLFAAGYAACFENALLHIARQDGTQLQGTAVEAIVGLRSTEAGPFLLDVTLNVEVGGLSQADAEKLVAQAHEVCPYSNATRGNIDVQLHTTVK